MRAERQVLEGRVIRGHSPGQVTSAAKLAVPASKNSRTFLRLLSGGTEGHQFPKVLEEVMNGSFWEPLSCCPEPVQGHQDSTSAKSE